jgi:uncharacterized protein YhfF
MSIKISEDIKTFWDEFINSSNNYINLKNYKFEAWSFGNTPEMADDLMICERFKVAYK